MVRARDRRSNGVGAGTEHQLVVRLTVGAPALKIPHLHLFGISVDANDLVLDAHIEGQLLGEALRSLQQQALTVRDFTADVVGQPAIGERDIAVALQDDDRGRLIEPPEPSGR